jgi:hypothetical protein
MQKWEYCVVYLSYTKKGVLVVSSLNDSELLGWQNSPHFSAILNQLGEQGWEVVVSLGKSSGGSTDNIILKRQKE